MAELQRRINSGRRHRGLEAGLECDGVGVAEVTKAIVLFAVALVTELEREPCVERGALGIGVRLDHAIYRVRQAEMTEENLASSHQEFADRRAFVRIFVQQTSDDGAFQLSLVVRLEIRGLRHRPRADGRVQRKALDNLARGHAPLTMFLTTNEDGAGPQSDRALHRLGPERPGRIRGDEAQGFVGFGEPAADQIFDDGRAADRR